MGRIAGLILLVGCILVGCQGAPEQPPQSDDVAAQSGQITKGIYEGAEETLKLVEKYSNGGLKSTLDWETTQRLLKEQMSKN